MQKWNEQLDDLLQSLKESSFYVEYHEALEDVKKDRELYRALNKYRKVSFALCRENDEDMFDKVQEIRRKYKDILSNYKITRFLIAEQEYCNCMKQMYSKIADELECDMSFFED